jgi:limonene-1,2-epoxide hydrolase
MSVTPNDSGAVDVVISFLRALESGDVAGAIEWLAPDAVWLNVTLPAVRGQARIERIFQLGLNLGSQFRVHFHHVAVDGNVVMTERTDAISLGRFEQRFWVYGRFEVEGGRIRVWRDAFDWLDILISLFRGAAGVLLPALNRPWPGDRAVTTASELS